jgi:hypothetical protein
MLYFIIGILRTEGKGKGKGNPKKAYVALRGPGG